MISKNVIKSNKITKSNPPDLMVLAQLKLLNVALTVIAYVICQNSVLIVQVVPSASRVIFLVINP